MKLQYNNDCSDLLPKRVGILSLVKSNPTHNGYNGKYVYKSRFGEVFVEIDRFHTTFDVPSYNFRVSLGTPGEDTVHSYVVSSALTIIDSMMTKVWRIKRDAEFDLNDIDVG